MYACTAFHAFVLRNRGGSREFLIFLSQGWIQEFLIGGVQKAEAVGYHPLAPKKANLGGWLNLAWWQNAMPVSFQCKNLSF